MVLCFCTGSGFATAAEGRTAGCGRYRAATAEEFRRRERFKWCERKPGASVHEMLTKLWNKTEFYVVAYSHQGCHRTSNAVDRPMNRLCRRCMQTGACTAIKARPRRLRGWALLLNFRPYAPRSNQRTQLPPIDSTANA